MPAPVRRAKYPFTISNVWGPSNAGTILISASALVWAALLAMLGIVSFFVEKPVLGVLCLIIIALIFIPRIRRWRKQYLVPEFPFAGCSITLDKWREVIRENWALFDNGQQVPTLRFV